MWSRCANLSHIVLNGAFADAYTQLEQFTTNPLCSPQSVVSGHFLDQGDTLCGDLWFGRICSGLVFPIELESLPMPSQERLWLDNEQRLLPVPNRPRQKNQEHPVRFGTGRSFHLSAEDNELLVQERVFCHEYRLATGLVSQCQEQERGVVRFCPGDEAVVERLKTQACQPLDTGENLMHSVCYLFVKMSK